MGNPATNPMPGSGVAAPGNSAWPALIRGPYVPGWRWDTPETSWNKVPAPIATLRNLNIVRNGKSSKPAFRSIFMWKSKFQGLKFVDICKKASLFSFWASGIAVFRPHFFEKNRHLIFSQEISYLKWSYRWVAQHHLCYMKWTSST